MTGDHKGRLGMTAMTRDDWGLLGLLGLTGITRDDWDD